MKYFGTDGVRGVANVSPLTPQWVTRCCFHAGRLLREQGAHGPVVLGRDTRRSGAWLSAAAAAGFCSAGLDVRDGGVLPTPAVSALVRRYHAPLGVVVSASHNPAPDNGLKFFAAGGGKVEPDFELALEARLEADPDAEQAEVTGDSVGSLLPWPDGEDHFVDFLVESFRDRLDLSGWRILVDAAHGAAYRTSPRVLEALGAQVTSLHCEPDGLNINEGCGALHPDLVQARVRDGDFDLGIVHDGDADRGFLVDAAGDLYDGEDMLYVLSTRADPRPAHAIGTVMNNLGLEKALEREGVELVRASVGDRNVRAEMLARSAPFGAEPSGHVIVDELGPTGDGLASCLAVLASLGGEKGALAGVREAWSRFPQVLLGVRVKEKPPLDEIEGYRALEAEVLQGLDGGGRVLVRYSGTEPKVRVMVEAEDAAAAEGAARRLADFLEEALGE